MPGADQYAVQRYSLAATLAPSNAFLFLCLYESETSAENISLALAPSLSLRRGRSRRMEASAVATVAMLQFKPHKLFTFLRKLHHKVSYFIRALWMTEVLLFRASQT